MSFCCDDENLKVHLHVTHIGSETRDVTCFVYVRCGEGRLHLRSTFLCKLHLRHRRFLSLSRARGSTAVRMVKYELFCAFRSFTPLFERAVPSSVFFFRLASASCWLRLCSSVPCGAVHTTAHKTCQLAFSLSSLSESIFTSTHTHTHTLFLSSLRVSFAFPIAFFYPLFRDLPRTPHLRLHLHHHISAVPSPRVAGGVTSSCLLSIRIIEEELR